jgi:enoyl-CoA hydratase/carnithine racemase
MAVTAEMAFGLRFDAERLHQLGFINRVVPTVDDLMGTAHAMADHLLSLPPAARVNTTRMLRAMRPRLDSRLAAFADALREHGAASDLVESRRAFAEKRPPVYRGWDDPADRARGPVLGGG